MNTHQATAEIFWTAFKALPEATRDDFLTRLVGNQRFRQDIMDLAVIKDRRGEKTRLFSEYLKERRART